MNTTTFGTGQLLMAATELGVQKIILGIGGSTTNDGGSDAPSLRIACDSRRWRAGRAYRAAYRGGYFAGCAH